MSNAMREVEIEFRAKVHERLCEIWKVDKDDAVKKLEGMIDDLMNSNSSLSAEDAENQVILEIINEKEDRQLDFLWFEYKEHCEKKPA